MRYDVPIYFQTFFEGVYDPKTGNYGEGNVAETEVFGSVLGTSTDTMTFVYGAIKQGSVTVHIQNAYTKPFDRIRIGEKVYGVDYARKLRTKQTFVLSEVL